MVRNAVLHKAIVKNKEAVLKHKGIKTMIADLFTKLFIGERFHLLMAVIMGWLTCSKLESIIDARNEGVCSEK